MTNPTIIAEVGSNWRTLTDCMTSIAMAKKAGADAVKFQAFSYRALYGKPLIKDRDVPDLTLGRDISEDYEADLDHSIPLDWLPKLKEKADACGIEFMCTAFSPELLEEVDPYVKVHKIDSSDLNYPELLAAAKKTGKPILLSVGASSAQDIKAALNLLEGADVTLMYCNSVYPSRRHDLFGIERLGHTFGLAVGLSDHSIDTYTPLSAYRHFDVPVIEKHFQAVEGNFPDTPHSLDTDTFKYMVDMIRGNRSTASHLPTSEEGPMFLRHNRRLIATKPIKIGDTLKYNENFGAYRSLKDDRHGVSPFVLLDERNTPNGKEAQKDRSPGDSIGPGDY